jgi:hypothetical protein
MKSYIYDEINILDVRCLNERMTELGKRYTCGECPGVGQE